MPIPRHIAILGGGLTGLSSAFHLSRRFPHSLITLLERQSRLGGWVRSEEVLTKDNNGPAMAVLEGGPRTLRANTKSVLELINLLGLESSVITTSKASPAARARFLHIPGTPGLLPIPSTIFSLIKSPLRSTLLSAVLREPFRFSNRPKGITDESLDSFITRRFGGTFARIFGSALVHGIYASDSRKLSVRAAFPPLWEAEERGWGSVVRGFLRPAKSNSTKDDYDLGNMAQLMKDTSVYSFVGGMETITKALEHQLSLNSNIRILRDASVISLQYENKSFKVTLSSGDPITPTHVVSALPLPALNNILPPSNLLPHLTVNPSSSVAVINLIFSAPPSEIHPDGFGYLIPRPEYDYSAACPSILGTVFDSSSLSAQDSSSSLTKLTVMMGGPYPALTPEHTSLTFVKKHLEDHLQRKLPDPTFYKVWQNNECIPTLMPGHLERMEEMRSVLKNKWDGRLEVIGAGVGGVSVGDCVEAGKRAGERWL